MEIQGYRYRIQATNADNGAQGVLIDQDGSSIPMTMQMVGEQIQVQAFNQGQAMAPLVFLLSQTQAGRQTATTAQPTVNHNGQLDPALVGLWVYSESYTSGDFGGAYQEKAYFYPDGRLGLVVR